MSFSLKQKIAELIDKIDAIANHLPLVLIVHNIRTTEVLYMSPAGLRMLGTTLADLQALGQDYHSIYFNVEESKEYAPKIFDMLQRNIPDEVVTFFQQVNLLGIGKWKWHISAVKVLLRDEHNEPVLIITTATPIESTDNISIKADKLVEENNFLRQYISLYRELTNSERGILQFIAQGKTKTEADAIANIKSEFSIGSKAIVKLGVF